jgi:hypothetical protein
VEERGSKPENPVKDGTGRLSRGALLTRAGAGLAAVGALGPSAALGQEAIRSRRHRLTPSEAALEIRRVLTGAKRFDLSDRQSRIWEVDRLLADPRSGAATIGHLRRQKPPRGVAAASEPSGSASSIPQDRISAATFWWGYSVYFPHDPLINEIVVYIQDHDAQALISALQAAMTVVDLGWVVTALKAYVELEVALLVYFDNKNDDGGSQLNAAWTHPLVYVPTES